MSMLTTLMMRFNHAACSQGYARCKTVSTKTGSVSRRNPARYWYGSSKRQKEARSMKAAVVHDFAEPLSVEDVPKPEPADGEVVIKIEASGLCQTDIHAAHGD